MRDRLPAIGAAVILLMVPALRGCLCGGGFESPCEEANYGCEESTLAFEQDPTCTLDGDLQVELGYGKDAYQTLAPGDFPKEYHGAQGGTHAYMGLRVFNPALDRYDKLLVRMGIYRKNNAPCGSSTYGIPYGADDAQCLLEVAERLLVLGDKKPIQPQPDGSIEEHGIVMFLHTTATSTLDRVVRLQVDDPCGRTGIYEYELPGTPKTP